MAEDPHNAPGAAPDRPEPDPAVGTEPAAGANAALEAELSVLRARLAEAEQANAALRHLESNRTRILSNVSHELRTPLVTVIGYVEMLLQGQLGEIGPDVERALKVVLRNALRQSNLIDDLLNLSRLQEGQFETNPERLDLARLVEDVMADQRFHLQEKDLDADVDVPPDLPPVLVDRRLTRILIENLVKNAVKFNQRGGRVQVRARPDGARVRVTVEDEGEGIPEAVRERVFVPFFQADSSSTRAYGGVGAGLALARRIVEAHGGQIRLEAPPEGGTRVTFDLPIGSQGG